MKKETGVRYRLGSLGGRGRHPADPTGELFGDTHWPLPMSHERGNEMNYMLIDITTMETTKLLLTGTLRQVQLHGRLLKADGRKFVAPPLEGRGLSRFKMEELQYMLWNTWNASPVNAKGEPKPFGDLLAECLHAAQQVLPDGTTIELLEAEVAKLAPPGDGETDEIDTECKPAKKATPRTQQKPGEAPAATSTTGKVWIIADRVLAAHPAVTATTDWKPIRETIIAACESEGINKATAATQYSKYKASKIANL